jgi:hypothetical protein
MNAKSLVKVVHVRVDQTGYYKACGFPFLLPVAEGETAQAVRKKIQTALNETDAGMSHIRLVAGDKYDKFQQENVLKGEQIVQKQLGSGYLKKSLLLVGSSDTSARRMGESIKIYN